MKNSNHKGILDEINGIYKIREKSKKTSSVNFVNSVNFV